MQAYILFTRAADRAHFRAKICSTFRIAATLVLARTFGTYRHSVFSDGLSYAIYEYRGVEWAFPTEPLTKEHLQ